VKDRNSAAHDTKEELALQLSTPEPEGDGLQAAWAEAFEFTYGDTVEAVVEREEAARKDRLHNLKN
jgi:hypothetical protein